MTSRLSFPPHLADRLRAEDERVLVTGATGWLGRAMLEMLAEALGPAFERRVLCFGSAPKTVQLRTRLIRQIALDDMESLPTRPSILFHFACLTKEKTAEMPLAEYVERNRSISAMAVRAAAKVGAERVFVTSSGASTQAIAASAPLDSAHAYGILKREEENLFERYAAGDEHRKVLVVRLFNLSGPYINKLHSYALSSFIEQARHTGIIQINSAHRVIRSYTGVENLLAIALSHLFDNKANPWTCLETAGERRVEVGEIAENVRALAGTHVVIRRPAMTPGKEDSYVGDPQAYRAMAARHGIELHDLERQVRDTFRYLISKPP